MRFDWLEALLPRAVLTPRLQILWAVFFALFPLAYFCGVVLETKEESPAMMSGFEDRASSIRIAEQFASSKGYPVTGWQQFATAQTDDSLVAYYGGSNDRTRMALSALAPGQEVQVLFRSPDQTHEFRTYQTLMGQVVGYDFGKSGSGGRKGYSLNTGIVTTTDKSGERGDEDANMASATKLSDEEAEAIARRTLSENAQIGHLVNLGKAHFSSNEYDSARQDVVWDESPAGLPDVTLHIAVGVRDGQVVGQHIQAKLAKKRKANTPAYRAWFEGLYSCLLSFGAIYATIRYAKRSLQREVSHLRTLAILAFFTVSYSTMIYCTMVDLAAINVSGAILSKVGIIAYVSALISFTIMGLLVGIAYGSGEGEVREAYPGKLTSLDALLAGRILSQDVGASILFGSAAAAWLLLAHQIVSYFLPGDVAATRTDVLTYTFSRIPSLTLLVGRQYDPLLMAIGGLLLPASFLLRRSTRKRKRFFWLILFAVGAVLHDASKYPTASSALLAVAVLACALLLPFFAFDLLAAMVSLSALSLVEELTRFSAVFPSWDRFALSVGAFAALVIVAATYLALRGTSVNEVDVMPLYAKNLAQRMALQAEVQAAREAQLRLLPHGAPQLPGVQFAAVCLPAHGVGGDFYDFFPLDQHRVGIFVAQGGDQGLASALCIALAKGVLMHSALQAHTPTQTLVDLELSLSTLLEGGNNNRVSFAYAVMDTRRNLLSYARLGASPRFVVYRKAVGVTPSAFFETLVPLAGRPKNAEPIYEGMAPTSVGDFLIFFTKGVTSLQLRRFGRREYRWVEALAPALERQDESMQAALTALLTKHQSRASDDLTAVLLKVTQAQSMLEEVVA